MSEQMMANNVVDSLVESQRQGFIAKGIDLGASWAQTQKDIWHNALKSGQCTVEELKKMVFNK